MIPRISKVLKFRWDHYDDAGTMRYFFAPSWFLRTDGEFLARWMIAADLARPAG